MRLDSRHLPDATLIIVAGEVDATTSEELESYIDRVRRRLGDHLIFEVSRLTFLDSSGLATLLAAATLARAHGAGVHLVAPRPRVGRLLDITGSWQTLGRHDTIEQALAAVRAKSPKPV
ncbi:MAG TPA: STAS domain-containing protein [Nonomuraea sp.]|nr:STAS domain-containing protein [Nonomuraea sp.]